MPSITLADIQAAADEKYGPLVIDLPDGPVELTNVIRLSKAKRDKLKNLDKANEAGDIDVDKKLVEVISLATRPADAKRLLAAIGGDLAQLTALVEMWTKTTQVGEASPSAS